MAWCIRAMACNSSAGEMNESYSYIYSHIQSMGITISLFFCRRIFMAYFATKFTFSIYNDCTALISVFAARFWLYSLYSGGGNVCMHVCIYWYQKIWNFHLWKWYWMSPALVCSLDVAACKFCSFISNPICVNLDLLFLFFITKLDAGTIWAATRKLALFLSFPADLAKLQIDFWFVYAFCLDVSKCFFQQPDRQINAYDWAARWSAGIPDKQAVSLKYFIRFWLCLAYRYSTETPENYWDESFNDCLPMLLQINLIGMCMKHSLVYLKYSTANFVSWFLWNVLSEIIKFD